MHLRQPLTLVRWKKRGNIHDREFFPNFNIPHSPELTTERREVEDIVHVRATAMIRHGQSIKAPADVESIWFPREVDTQEVSSKSTEEVVASRVYMRVGEIVDFLLTFEGRVDEVVVPFRCWNMVPICKRRLLKHKSRT